MKILIVYAHHEPKSFNSALKDLTVSVLTEKGHELKISDLYAMNFKPVADRHDFRDLSDPEHMNYMLEQKNASEKGEYIGDIIEEHDKVRWADAIIFHFPIWWFSVPAILKGWFDRVLSTGFSWDFGKIYDKGLLTGKKAILVVTTGGPAEYYTSSGPHGASIHQMLYPITHGTLQFCGMQVLPPFIAFGVFQAGDEGRKKYLGEYKKRLEVIDSTAPMPDRTIADL
jgi:NAD(P)H dehydrogenase (quinone)